MGLDAQLRKRKGPSNQLSRTKEIRKKPKEAVEQRKGEH
jgi:hypothetical protein